MSTLRLHVPGKTEQSPQLQDKAFVVLRSSVSRTRVNPVAVVRRGRWATTLLVIGLLDDVLQPILLGKET